MPFKYGIATMTHLPHVFLWATLEIDGRRQDGVAADHLPPKWFTKDPTRDPLDEIGEMLRVILHTMAVAERVTATNAFAFWQELYRRQAAWAAAEKIPPLLAHFGTSLVERAVLDAVARTYRTPFHRLLRSDALGVNLGALHRELGETRPGDWLPAAPLAKMIARHTVGLADPLQVADIPPAERVDDGLPQALADCIRAYGLRHFKIKISGRRDADIDRLERITDVLARNAPSDFACSLDGNESFHHVADFCAFMDELAARPRLKDLIGHLLFVEQPFHRDIALTAEMGAIADRASALPPIIIDESDAEMESLPRAIELGYAGTSHKNCKGVFKGVANACRIAQLRRSRPGARFLMSGEDLANIGPVALLQDLAVQAALGIESIERNGHHYFAGLSFWPDDMQAAMLESHGDLYTRSARGWPRLDVRDGELALGSVNAAPFGLAAVPDLGAFTRVA